MFFCSFVFLCVTSSVSFTGFYTKDEPGLHRFLALSTPHFCSDDILRCSEQEGNTECELVTNEPFDVLLLKQ